MSRLATNERRHFTSRGALQAMRANIVVWRQLRILNQQSHSVAGFRKCSFKRTADAEIEMLTYS